LGLLRSIPCPGLSLRTPSWGLFLNIPGVHFPIRLALRPFWFEEFEEFEEIDEFGLIEEFEK
jgi:hypothetical protein